MERKKKKGCLNTKDYLKAIAENQTEIINTMFAQNKRLEEANHLKKMELEVKDRVDISLNEYNAMKSELAERREQVGKLGAIMAKFGLAEFVETMIPQSCRVETMEDPARRTTRVLIQFDVRDMLN